MTRPSGGDLRVGVEDGAMKQRSVASKTAWSRLLAVSSGQNSRKLPPPSGRVSAA